MSDEERLREASREQLGRILTLMGEVEILRRLLVRSFEFARESPGAKRKFAEWKLEADEAVKRPRESA